MKPPFSSAQVRRIGGFGMAQWADAYVVQPRNVEALAEVFEAARRSGLRVALRGGGMSYGDAAMVAESVVADCSLMTDLELDSETGAVRAGAGITIGDLWRAGLPHGWWPPVVSGTQWPTLGGALAMNIHGKNAVAAGTLGEHVTAIECLTTRGEAMRLTPADADFSRVISSAGLLAAITRVELQMKAVRSGDLDVVPISCKNWDEQFRAFEETAAEPYQVSWIDAFATGAKAGRGQFHAASHVEVDDRRTLQPGHQDLPEAFFGTLPRSEAWRFLRHFTVPHGMKRLNRIKYFASRLGDRRRYRQSLVAFSFLLDYLPNWQRAYLPGGLIQYQCFVPAASARDIFAELLEMQHRAGLVNFLSVMKRHRTDRFLFSHGVDGYSLAMDFKVTEANRARLWDLCHAMNDRVLDRGGRFYLAKDSTLRPQDVRRWLGDEGLDTYRDTKARFDPEGLLTSALAQRLGL